MDQCFAYDQPLLWPDQTTQKIQKYPFMRGRSVFLTQKHEMGPAVELSPRNPAIHSHAFTRNLLSKRALSYSSQCQQHRLSHYYPYHCQRQRENKEVTN